MSLRRIALLGSALSLLSGAVLAQTPPTFTGANGEAVAGDPIKLEEMKANLAAKADYSGPLALVPDAFRLAADAGDDALAVQRAVNAACTGTSRHMRLLGRHYSMRSPVMQTCLLSWHGQGWQEQPVGTDLTGATLAGTWLDFTAGAFGPSGTSNPVTLSGVYAAGSVIQGIGVSQPVTMPATGASSWTPADTPFLFWADNANGGVEFRDILCRGVNKCLGAHISGRTSFRNIRGQAWRVLVFVDKSYDASRVDEIHAWPYYSTDNRIMAFQQASAAAVLSLRSDTPLFGRIFAFGTNGGLVLDASAAEGSLGGGTTTGATVDSLSCDFVRHCLLGTVAATGVQVQIGQLRTFGQAWGTTDTQVANRAGMLAGSDVIAMLGGGAVIQVGNLENYGTDDTTVRLTNASPANVQIGSAYIIGTRLSANATLTAMTGGTHTVTIGMPPVITADTPSGWLLGNSGSAGSLFWPTSTKRN